MNQEIFSTPSNSHISIARGWMPKPNADNLLRRIQEEIPFCFYRRRAYDRDYDVPRGMFYFGNRNLASILKDGTVPSIINHGEKGQKFNTKSSYTNVVEWDIPLEILTIPLKDLVGDKDVPLPLYQRIYAPSHSKTYIGESVGTVIRKLMEDINQQTGYNYDSALINEYATGSSHISPHRDKESLGLNNSVMGLSLGGTRNFHFNPIKGASPVDATKIRTTVNHGDLMLMYGAVQNWYTHSVPKQAKGEYRVSITFRHLGN